MNASKYLIQFAILALCFAVFVWMARKGRRR